MGVIFFVGFLCMNAQPGTCLHMFLGAATRIRLNRSPALSVKLLILAKNLARTSLSTEMDDLDARLSCDICSQDGRIVIATWHSAVSSVFLVL
jgi:hypothetical protein